MGDFANVFKKLRIAKGLTQDELASKLNISRSRIGMYETGAREPDFDTLEMIADFFNVDIDYLLGRNKKTTYIPTPIDLYSDVSYSMMNTLLARNGKKLTKDEKMALITILSSPDEPEDHDPKKQDRVPDLRKTEDGYVMGTKRVDENE